ncbi:hypothetical protein [Flavicella sediminum]|uniref:hypothetical protein n=1 Tax=Flavicella sediminum TaxID=2585141 RepID=UPI001123051C|nr:hypothetical protein [Flavicella sediminum]
MKKNILLLIAVVLNFNFLVAQESINEYAYIVVPDEFSFQRSPDEFQLNSLAKFLLKKQNVLVFGEYEDIPEQYRNLNCGGLNFKLNKESSAFRTKLSFELRDCRNKIVYKSEVGTSLEKDYKKGYQESLRNAFANFHKLNYKYEPKIAIAAQVIPVVTAKVPSVVAALQTPTKSAANVYTSAQGLAIQLEESNGSYIGKVLKSTSINYTEGQLICKLFQTSLASVFKAEWKDAYGNFVNTIAYFDAEGNLNVDLAGATGITVVKFAK